jgi:branched-chain amino acid transport system ATP-binding protein
MSDAVLIAKNIGVRFGDFQALTDLSISIAPNTVHSLIGPNGAGKTTFFNALTGVRAPTDGNVFLDGREVTKVPAYRRVGLGMSRSFQITSLYPDLTVTENIRLAVQARYRQEGWVVWRNKDSRTDIVSEAHALLTEVSLNRKANEIVGNLSHAGQRSLEIAMALAGRPKIIFLDEPLAGMGIDDVHRTKELISALKQRMAVVLIEHNMSVVLNISDVVTVMAGGKKIAEGAPSLIRHDATVRSAYLGSSQ